MSINIDEIIKKRVLNKELYIKKLANKYIELQNIYSSLDVNKDIPQESKTHIEKIINDIEIELNNVELQFLKTTITLSTIENDDKPYLANTQVRLMNEIESVKKEIFQNIKKNSVLIKDKSDRLECEDLAREINKYQGCSEINSQIECLSKECKLIQDDIDQVNSLVNYKTSQISLILKLIDELSDDV